MPNETENTGAPDFLVALWKRTRNRRTIQLSLAYLASGFAIIQFVKAAMDGSPRLEGILDAVWIIFGLGLLVVLFAVPLVMTGTHPFRTGFIVGIVLTALAAGMFLQTRISSNDEPSSEPSSEPNREQGQTSGKQSPNYDRLLLLYGSGDALTLEAKPGRVELFADHAHPIDVRFATYQGSRARLLVTAERGGSTTLLDLNTVGARENTTLTIPTSCGTLSYRLDVVRLREAAEVTIAVDDPRSRASVARAEALGECSVE